VVQREAFLTRWLWSRWEARRLPLSLLEALDADREVVARHESAHVVVGERLGLQVDGTALVHALPRPIGATHFSSREDPEADYRSGRMSKGLRARVVAKWAGIVDGPELGAVDMVAIEQWRGCFGARVVDPLREVAASLLDEPDVKTRRVEIAASLVHVRTPVLEAV
jgi:hypothetical protein